MRQKPPAFAVDQSSARRRFRPRRLGRAWPPETRCRSIVLTGYGNFATAVSAVKLGAVDYLAKPADADEVTDALLAPSDERAPPPENPMSAESRALGAHSACLRTL